MITQERKPLSNKQLSLFAPPNLLQSTTAAFLNLVALPQPPLPSSPRKTESPKEALAILIPSRRAPLPTPRSLSLSHTSPDNNSDSNSIANTSLEGLTFLKNLEDTEDWDPALFRSAHKVLLSSAGLGASETGDWHVSKSGLGTARIEGSSPTSRRRKVGEAESGMYI